MKTTRRLNDQSENAICTNASGADASSAAPEQSLVDPRVVIAQADPRDLVGELEGNGLRLRWWWPNEQQIQIAVVVWCADRWPDAPDEVGAHSDRIARRSYDAHGGFRCDVPADLSRVYVRVYSALLAAHRAGFDTWLYSPGLETTSRRIIQRSPAVVSRLIRRRNARYPDALEVRTLDDSPLPQLLVVRSKDFPLRASEGIEFARYQGGASQCIFHLLEAVTWPRGTWIRVFSSVDGFSWRAERCNHQL
jgi:hypothetical protein